MSLSTKVIPHKILDVIKKSKPAYNLLRRGRFAVGSVLGARNVEGILGRVHYNDFMLASTSQADTERYYMGAVSFVNILEKALKSCRCDWSDVKRCLEVGSGYGRIVRVLKEKISSSRIYVCDVIDEGAKFTASEFGAIRIPILEKTANKHENFFNLVYLLSVYTHMREEHVEQSIRLIARALKPGGVLVFTTQGEISARTAEQYNQFWLDRELLSSELAKNGYFYSKYPHYYEDYGMTWFTADRVKQLVARADKSLEFIDYDPAGLDKHQDVFVYRVGGAGGVSLAGRSKNPHGREGKHRLPVRPGLGGLID